MFFLLTFTSNLLNLYNTTNIPNISKMSFSVINAVIIEAKKQDRDKIAELLAAEGGIKILAHGKDGYDALKLIGSLKPDIAIMDSNLDYIEGNEIPPLVKARSPSTMVVILAGKINDNQLLKAAANHVSGFVYKETDLHMLPEALKQISRGGCFISPALAFRILHLFSLMNDIKLSPGAAPVQKYKPEPRISPLEDPVGRLSKAELSILTCLCKGLASNEIAEHLGLAVGTVRNRISSLMNKLGLKSRTNLVRYAINYGLVIPEGDSHLFF